MQSCPALIISITVTQCTQYKSLATQAQPKGMHELDDNQHQFLGHII